MATMTVFAMLMALLFGGMMLALVMGYLSTEKQRALDPESRQADATAREVAEIPRFFADPAEAPAVFVSTARHDEFIDQFEGYLRAEQALVARFVNEPSIDNLYRQAPASRLIQ